MGHLSWAKIQRVFRSKTSPESPGKNRTKSPKSSRSFSFFRNASSRSSFEKRDDTSSFMSPEPEDYRRNTLDSVHTLALSDSNEWNQAGTDSVRLSFVQCTEILSFFPDPPATPHPRTDPSGRRLSHPRPAIPSAFRSTETAQNDDRSGHSYCSHGKDSKSRRRRLRKVQGRTPTPYPHPIRYGPFKNSPIHAHTIPFDLLSRAEHAKLSEEPARSYNTAASRSPSSSSVGFSETSEGSNAATISYSQRYATRRRSFRQLQHRRHESPINRQPLSAPPSETLFTPMTISPPNGPTFHVPGLERRSKPSHTTTSLFNDSPIRPLWL